MQDPNTKFTPGSLSYNHSGDGTIMTSLYQKSNGVFYIAIWQEVTCFNIQNNTDIFNIISLPFCFCFCFCFSFHLLNLTSLLYNVNPVPVTLKISAAVSSYKVYPSIALFLLSFVFFSYNTSFLLHLIWFSF